VDDLLRDLRSAGHGKIRVIDRDPTGDETVQRDAASLGIQPVQFNVVGNASLQVKQGYLGLAIQYQGKSQAIPFVNETDDLEYRLVSAIRALTRTTKPVVGLYLDASGPYAQVQALQQQLEKSYTVRTLSPTDSMQPAPDVQTVVMVGSPDSLSPAVRARFDAFFRRGGGALVLSSGMQPNQQMPMAMPRPVGWNAVLKPLGVSVPSNMVYDLAANEIVPVSSGGQQVLARYPFFLHAQSTGASVVNQQVDNVLLTWPSSVDTTASNAYAFTPLLETTRGGGVLTGEASIEPTRDFPQYNLGPQLLAVQVAPRDTTAHGRAIVVGNTDFIADRIAGRAPENLDFALNAVDWLSQDEALISIRSKNRNPPALAFASAATKNGVKYFNVIGVPVCIILAGLVALNRRRRKTREPYRPLAAGGAA
jgi:ABC-type uncharacterized transport system involved in gliding motility auxiliary subunit